MTIAIAIVAGLLIGLSLGALGGGGSILTVPVLVYFTALLVLVAIYTAARALPALT